MYQKLSEPFIEKHKVKVNWYNVLKSQNLSNEFKLKYNLLKNEK